MSRNLPPHPNLEHLKKQAKDLLHELLLQNPALKLADAQHAIAPEYGFASWPKLKAHVESQSRAAGSVDASQADSDHGEVNPDEGFPLIDSPSIELPEQANPFVGRWTANLAKSSRHPDNQFQSATLRVEVVGDTVTIDDVTVSDAGREDRGKNTITADGLEHDSERGKGYELIASWRGSHVLETVAKKDGKVAGWGRYECSADGRTLTVSADQQMIVLDRS